MAENVGLEYLLEGISTLETKEELDAVRDAVKERRKELKVARARGPRRVLTEEEKTVLAKGNSAEMILVNKEKYDYSDVKDPDRLTAEKWFKAPKPYSKSTAYHQWRVWNWPDLGDKYKGGLIIEKATGKSVPPPEMPQTPEWESEPECESEPEEEEVSEEETETVTVAMAAVRVE